MYLVDTNVISATAPARHERYAALVEWMRAHSHDLYLSTVTVAETSYGIAKMRRTGSASEASRLEAWLELVLHLYANRVLPFNTDQARTAGALTDRARDAGHDPGFADIAIAATALSRNLVVLTRNLRHFQPLQIPAHDPFDTLPRPPASP